MSTPECSESLVDSLGVGLEKREATGRDIYIYIYTIIHTCCIYIVIYSYMLYIYNTHSLVYTKALYLY